MLPAGCGWCVQTVAKIIGHGLVPRTRGETLCIFHQSRSHTHRSAPCASCMAAVPECTPRRLPLMRGGSVSSASSAATSLPGPAARVAPSGAVRTVLKPVLNCKDPAETPIALSRRGRNITEPKRLTVSRGVGDCHQPLPPLLTPPRSMCVRIAAHGLVEIAPVTPSARAAAVRWPA
jgi:hypothetical protein